MKTKRKPLFILLTLCMIVGLLPWTVMPVSAQSPYGHNGSGTADDPYQISTAQQWEFFANDMVSLSNNNDTYGDKYYKLTANITVDTNDTSDILVGGHSTTPFRGHFDGGGYTLTFNYSGSYEGAAPFQYVNGATIENLKVAGTININAGKCFAAGIAGYVTGNTTISNCTSSVSISSNRSGSGQFGGLVGSVASGVTLNINRCVFNGSITGSTTKTSGGFVGYNLGTVNITDSLLNPANIGVDMYSFVQNMSSGTSSMTRAYRTWDSSSSNQGIKVYSAAPDSLLTKKVTLFSNQYYAEGGASITGINSSYELFGTSMALPDFQVEFDGATLSSENYDYVFKNSSGTTVSSIAVPGTYTLTVSGKGDYAGSISKSFDVSGHKVTVLPAQNGNVSADKTSAVYGSTVTLTAVPDSENYKLLGLSVKDTAGNDITVADNKFTMPDSAVTVSAVFGLAGTDVYYIDSNGDVKTPTEAVRKFTGSSTTLSSGWYLASGQINIASRVSVSGDVHLILKDGAVVNIPKGIGVNVNNTLTIYGQANNSGELTITDPYYTDSLNRGSYPAGIGGDDEENCGTIVINGGSITVSGASYSTDTTSSAAIGGAYHKSFGNITINGGIIHATGGRCAAGIGGGADDIGGTITINGGNITANAGSANNAAGIGKGYSGNGGTISLSWSKTTDSIYAGSYDGTLTLNKPFVLSNDGSAATTSNIGGKTITPAYTVTVAATEHGTVVPGQTAYRYGSTVTLTVTPASGYQISSVKYGSTEIEPAEGVYSFEMPAEDVTVTATFSLIPATAPTITTQPSDLDLQNGASSGNVLTVEAEPIADHTLSYQWYSNTTDSNEGGALISGAMSASYTVPTDTDGTKYYYCVVTATHTNSQTASTTSDVAMVTVTSKTLQTISFADEAVKKTYGDAAFTITATGAHTTVTYSSGNTDVATVNENTGAVTVVGVGEAVITAAAATDETYAEATASYTLTVNAKPVTITGLSVSNKEYDGTTAATVTGAAAIDGIIGSDAVTVSAGTAAFADKNVGTGKTVTFTGYSLTDADAGNYALSAQPASVTASITAKAVTVSGITASNKEYDGTTDATLNFTSATFGGKLESDTLSVTATGTFENANASDGKTVNISNLTLGGTDAGNYTLAANGQQESTMANITQKAVTVAAKEQTAEVDGTISQDVSNTELTGALEGHTLGSVTLTGDTSAVTTTGTITPSAATIKDASENDVTGNYNISYSAGTLTVTSVQVYISGVTASDKNYDGGTTATVTGTAVLKKVSDDSVINGLSITGNITASFADKNVGTGKAVTISAATLSDADNYTLSIEKSNEKLGLTASITAKAVTVTGVTAINRNYDPDNLTVELTGGTVSGKAGSDTVTVDLSAATGTMADANAGENKAVTVSGVKLGGTAAGNYALSAQPTEVTVTIGKAANPATITGTASVMCGGHTVDLSANVSANGATGAVSYEISSEENGCSLCGSVLTTGANTGSVTVNVTIAEHGNYLALEATPITVTISDKNTQTITASDVTATYGDTGVKIEAATTSGGGALSYALKSGDAVTVNETTGALTIVKAGSAVITVRAAETATYAQATKDVNVTVNTKAMTVSAEDVNVTVDGQPHGITVSVTDPASGATVKYGTEAGSYTLDTSPTQTEVGEKTVYYQVTADNYTTYTGSAKVTVSAKQIQTISASDVTATYGDTGRKVTATTNGNGTISYAVKDGSADYIYVNESTGALTIKKVGTATVVVTAAETATYAQVTMEVTVIINKANAVAATVTANNRTYDGTEKPLVTVDNSTLVGGTMYYAVTTENTAPVDNLYTTSIPRATNAGTYYVWYKAAGKDNYADSLPSCVICRINERETFTVRFDANGGTGTMEPQTFSEGEQFVFPTCTFIAPAGKMFAHWKAGDRSYPENDTITVKSDLTAVAVWTDEKEIKGTRQETLKEVPAELKSLYDTVQQIETALLEKLMINGQTPVRGKTVFIDVELMISRDGGKTWVKATAEDFREGGITVEVDYPEGTNGREYLFAVAHMLTIDMNGRKAGEIEIPEVETTEKGLRFTLNGLSPVAISWQKLDDVAGASLPNTGDGSNPIRYMAMLLIALAGIGMIVRKRK